MQHYTKFALAVAAILLVGLSSWGQGSETESALHLVINEIEINPAGLDTDSEWVELLNPTDGPIDLLGWHAFRLMDPEGNVVEETAPFKDESDDDATWQRFPDGGDPLFIDLWLFQAGSRNKSNS
jgi:hypothetical protein